MRFTDIFINKPVLATVVSLFILLLGMRAMFDLNVRQFPEVKNAVVTVSTSYIGANADLVQGFITTPLEREVAAAEGIDYLVSTSVPGISVIQAHLRLDHDPNEALTQIAAQVNKVRGDLPAEAEDPVVELSVGESIAAMYLSFFSDRLANNQITDYLTRVVEPELSTIAGVQRAEILGGETFAMRLWLDADRMAAALIEARFAVCVQVEGPVTSHYRWDGQVRRDEEYRLMVKFMPSQLAALEMWLGHHHPYENPEWVVIAADHVAEKYLSWAQASSTSPSFGTLTPTT
jgi:uncharacterized protein involved in tolerance to divalent cations